MKKKTFIQSHLVLIFINCFFLFLLLIGVWALIDPSIVKLPKVGTGIKKIIVLVLYYIGLLYISWIGITYNHHWITFREEHIYVPSDWRIKRNRRQYRVEVKYENIVDISFIRSTKNSKNKTIQEESSRPFYHQYLVLYLKNGRKEKILVDYYTKKQKLKILEELKRRLEYCKNDIDLTNAQETLQNLGMFGVKFYMDISEKYDEKKRKKKEKRKMKSEKRD